MPCNRFADKINIFLPIVAYDKTLVKNTDANYIISEEDSEDVEDAENCEENARIYISNNNINGVNEDSQDYHINTDLLHEIDFGD